MKKDIEWLKEWLDEYEDETFNEIGDIRTNGDFGVRLREGPLMRELLAITNVQEKLAQLDEPDYTYDAYREGFKEGERQTAEYFESITEEPSQEQVQKYLSERGFKVVDKEPETVADVVTTFWKSYERLKEVMSMEVEELEE